MEIALMAVDYEHLGYGYGLLSVIRADIKEQLGHSNFTITAISIKNSMLLVQLLLR